MKEINIEDSIYKLVKDDEDFLTILYELGFSDIVKPGMIQTVGRFMNLKKGATAKKIPLKEIIESLEKKGYKVIGDLNE